MTPSRSSIALILGTIALACQPGPIGQLPSSAQPPNRNEHSAMPAPAPSSYRAILTPASPGEYGVRFVLSNPTSHAISLDSYEPFLQFHVRATVNGTALTIEQPTLDIPLNPITLSVPASGQLELATPVRLRFGGAPSQDGFVWSIAHAPAGVELTFALDLPAPFDQPFTTRI